jgi:hypothetical protein
MMAIRGWECGGVGRCCREVDMGGTSSRSLLYNAGNTLNNTLHSKRIELK